jgi:stress response protein YsnF
MIAPEPERTERGWRVRIPVQREHVWVEKQSVVYEEVDISRESLEPTAVMSPESTPVESLPLEGPSGHPPDA